MGQRFCFFHKPLHDFNNTRTMTYEYNCCLDTIHIISDPLAFMASHPSFAHRILLHWFSSIANAESLLTSRTTTFSNAKSLHSRLTPAPQWSVSNDPCIITVMHPPLVHLGSLPDCFLILIVDPLVTLPKLRLKDRDWNVDRGNWEYQVKIDNRNIWESVRENKE